MEEDIKLLNRLYRLRAYLYAFQKFFQSLSDLEKSRFRLYKGIPAEIYCSDFISLIEKMISHYSHRLCILGLDDLPSD